MPWPAHIPQSFLAITLISNFGTFLLYMMSCFIAVVAFHEHHMHGFIKHKFIPIFGLLANLLCMVFYLVGPFFVSGMSWKEPYVALGCRRHLGHLRCVLLHGSKQEDRQADDGDRPTDCGIGMILNLLANRPLRASAESGLATRVLRWHIL